VTVGGDEAKEQEKKVEMVIKPRQYADYGENGGIQAANEEIKDNRAPFKRHTY